MNESSSSFRYVTPLRFTAVAATAVMWFLAILHISPLNVLKVSEHSRVSILEEFDAIATPFSKTTNTSGWFLAPSLLLDSLRHGCPKTSFEKLEVVVEKAQWNAVKKAVQLGDGGELSKLSNIGTIQREIVIKDVEGAWTFERADGAGNVLHVTTFEPHVSDEFVTMHPGIDIPLVCLIPTHRRPYGPLALPVPRNPMMVMELSYGVKSLEVDELCSKAPTCEELRARNPSLSFVTERVVSRDGHSVEETIEHGYKTKILVEGGAYTKQQSIDLQMNNVLSDKPLAAIAKEEAVPVQALGHTTNFGPPPSTCVDSNGKYIHTTLCFDVPRDNKHLRKFRRPWSPSRYQRAVELLREGDRFFTENNLSYHMCAGTLLGSIRHGDLIPWDDDIDLCMLKSDIVLAIDIIQRNPESRFDVFVETNGKQNSVYAKLFLKRFPAQGHYNWTLPFLDLFPFDVSNSTIIYRYNSLMAPIDKVVPIHRRPLGPLLLPSPRDPMRNLELFFNERILEDCVSRNWAHGRETGLSSQTEPCDQLWPYYPFIVRRTPLLSHWFLSREANETREFVGVNGTIIGDFIVSGGLYGEYVAPKAPTKPPAEPQPRMPWSSDR